MAGLFLAVSCSKDDNEDKDNAIDSGKSIWECIPEPSIIITLTIDSKQNKAYASTSPKNLSGIYSPNHKRYVFIDDDQYIMRGDTLHIGNPDSSVVSGAGFVQTIHSSDSMRLEYFGITVGIPDIVREYLFYRKTN